MKKVKIKTPDINLVTVCQLTDALQAELIKNTLLEHAIQCDIEGEHQAGFTGALEVGILVREADAQRAAEIIKTHYPHI